MQDALNKKETCQKKIKKTTARGKKLVESRAALVAQIKAANAASDVDAEKMKALMDKLASVVLFHHFSESLVYCFASPDCLAMFFTGTSHERAERGERRSRNRASEID